MEIKMGKQWDKNNYCDIIPDVLFVPESIMIATITGGNLLFATASASGIVSFDADGFTVTDSGTDAAPNANGVSYVFVAFRSTY